MKILKEITEWNAEFSVPNHIYFVSDNKEKVYAYAKRGTTEVFEFKTPYNFNTRGRKFVSIPNVYNYSHEDEPVKEVGEVHTVRGSTGREYTVTRIAGKYICNCPAGQFRGKCRHADEIAKQISVA